VDAVQTEGGPLILQISYHPLEEIFVWFRAEVILVSEMWLSKAKHSFRPDAFLSAAFWLEPIHTTASLLQL
jgi:hypothetical protein